MLAWAHPRACGENASQSLGKLGGLGSSPRMRGKLELSVDLTLHDRLIPAHAGKTPTDCATPLDPAAHPRACGENSPANRLPWLQRGSSPRMRGKQLRANRLAARLRLIPAHAGKTKISGEFYQEYGAHPRACGENLAAQSGLCDSKGSSPRMRGKRHDPDGGMVRTGLIPAHAGKTHFYSLYIGISWAHPRACGENAGELRKFSGYVGSSPRMRGKHFIKAKLRDRLGLIPAHAGKTGSTASPREDAEAHPRACGENID